MGSFTDEYWDYLDTDVDRRSDEEKRREQVAMEKGAANYLAKLARRAALLESLKDEYLKVGSMFFPIEFEVDSEEKAYSESVAKDGNRFNVQWMAVGWEKTRRGKEPHGESVYRRAESDGPWFLGADFFDEQYHLR